MLFHPRRVPYDAVRRLGVFWARRANHFGGVPMPFGALLPAAPRLSCSRQVQAGKSLRWCPGLSRRLGRAEVQAGKSLRWCPGLVRRLGRAAAVACLAGPDGQITLVVSRSERAGGQITAVVSRPACAHGQITAVVSRAACVSGQITDVVSRLVCWRRAGAKTWIFFSKRRWLAMRRAMLGKPLSLENKRPRRWPRKRQRMRLSGWHLHPQSLKQLRE